MNNLRLFLKRLIVFILDFLSRVSNVSLPENKKKQLKHFKNIVFLLDAPLGIGDIVMLSPFVKYFEDSFDKKNIFVCSNFYSIFHTRANNLSFSDFKKMARSNETLVISPAAALRFFKFWFYSKNYIGFFWSFTLKSNIQMITSETKFSPTTEHFIHQAEMISNVLGIDFKASTASFPTLIEEKIEMPFEGKKYIVIAPYCNWPERTFPRDKWVRLIRQMSPEILIVFVGSNNKQELSLNLSLAEELDDKDILNLTGETSISQLAYLLKNASAYLGNDSGVTHLATVCTEKSGVIFGCVHPDLRVPKNKSLNVRSYSSANRCSYYTCYNFIQKPTCKSNFECMQFIDEKKIIQELGLE